MGDVQRIACTQPSDPGSLVFYNDTAGLLAFPRPETFPFLSLWNSGLDIPTDLMEITAAGTAPDLHRVPFHRNPNDPDYLVGGKDTPLIFTNPPPSPKKKKVFLGFPLSLVTFATVLVIRPSVRKPYKRESGANPEQCPLL